jgi:copper chaperone
MQIKRGEPGRSARAPRGAILVPPPCEPERTMIELTLPTMTCGHCVKTVTQTVKQLDAAAQVDIDLEQHRVRIESALPAEPFKKALAEEGYAAA